MKEHIKQFQHEHLFFWTSTVLDWIWLFGRKDLAAIILSSFNYMTKNNWLQIFAYVVMPNHLHAIIKIAQSHSWAQIQRDFHKFTAQQIIKILRNGSNPLLQRFRVNKKDRKYQIWQREPKLKNIYTREFLLQKVEYIHNNPLQSNWRLVDSSEEYPYSSARFYLTREEERWFHLSDLRELW